MAISKHFKKPTYSLIYPYMNQIAPYILEQLPLQPELLGEACHVMGVAPRDFIHLTLPRTLPVLFATGDVKVLNKIAKELSTKISALVLNYSSYILAHIFLLPGQSATKKALTFVAKVLTDASTSSIDIPSVVRSCVVPLLADLVVEMGDENNINAKQVCDRCSFFSSLFIIFTGGQSLEKSRRDSFSGQKERYFCKQPRSFPKSLYSWCYLYYKRHVARRSRQEISCYEAKDSA